MLHRPNQYCYSHRIFRSYSNPTVPWPSSLQPSSSTAVASCSSSETASSYPWLSLRLKQQPDHTHTHTLYLCREEEELSVKGAKGAELGQGVPGAPSSRRLRAPYHTLVADRKKKVNSKKIRGGAEVKINVH